MVGSMQYGAGAEIALRVGRRKNALAGGVDSGQLTADSNCRLNN